MAMASEPNRESAFPGGLARHTLHRSGKRRCPSQLGQYCHINLPRNPVVMQRVLQDPYATSSETVNPIPGSCVSVLRQKRFFMFLKFIADPFLNGVFNGFTAGIMLVIPHDPLS